MEFLRATFIKRLNRFSVKCELKGKDIIAHLPNSGRLLEILLPGKKIYLKKSYGKFPFCVWAGERDGKIILLHTHYTNKVAGEILKRGLISDFRNYRIKGREVKVDGERIDFILQRGNEELLLEVKSCTLFENSIAMFPDAVTLRGKKQVELLARKGGAILFLVHSGDVKFFLPDFHTDPSFARTLYKLRKSLIIKAVSLEWDENMDFTFKGELKIPWHIYEKEMGDRGGYIIIGELKNEISLSTEKRKWNLKKGYYIYTGSAMKYLSKRIKRHLRKEKKFFWHIDYLIPHLEKVKIFPIYSSVRIECLISRELEVISDGFVKNFGSSDCSCKSHLYYMRINPLENEKFLKILLYFRISRLKNYL